ncbi:MAG: hypothetical protein CMF54_05495 [Legionellales bacterium]|jgi:hypothetical protein|nr:hypothetical protein [Legionellales bacterium]|tara:strand:- start:1486 stop:2151 length:666 start_codon:yes stop_codon:yes gene_type:complete
MLMSLRFKILTHSFFLLFLFIGRDVFANDATLPDYDVLREKITFGNANFSEVREALTEPDILNLTNTLHALYSMRWHRAVLHLLQNIWERKREKYPELAWDLLEKIPPRIALASTINRIRIFNTDEYKAYIRSHRYADHEFVRAQVVVSLGLNGDPDDVDYLVKMVNSSNHYVVQTAMTSLALMGHVRAKEAMITLEDEYRDEPRGKLLRELLKKAYQWGE